MAVKIREYEIQVDIANEIQKYNWHKARWMGDKFIACSPFRFERHPSFAVRLDTGVWIDSGTDDEEWKRGNVVKLLSWLRNETYEETEEYLLAEYYSFYLTQIDSVKLELNLSFGQPKPKRLDPEVMTPYKFRHPYLENVRGIEERLQRGFGVGYDKENRAIVLPWYDKNGKLVNIKFRSIKDKRFWYYQGGQPVKQHVYGLHLVIRKGAKRVYIVESEIDAMTLWQAGYPAIALGGAVMTDRQRELILQTGIGEVIIATDNDKAGRLIAKSINDQLNGYVTIYNLIIPDHAKDVNDLTREELLSVVVNEKAYSFAV